MKIKKSYLILIISVLILLIGVSFAYFSLEITGNDTAKYNTITTGELKLTFTDTNVLTLDNALPGDSVTKTISVKNTGTIDTSYNIVWKELTNTITNDELVIEATCKRLNSSGTEEGTCSSISQKAVSSDSNITSNIPITLSGILIPQVIALLYFPSFANCSALRISIPSTLYNSLVPAS